PEGIGNRGGLPCTGPLTYSSRTRPCRGGGSKLIRFSASRPMREIENLATFLRQLVAPWRTRRAIRLESELWAKAADWRIPDMPLSPQHQPVHRLLRTESRSLPSSIRLWLRPAPP